MVLVCYKITKLFQHDVIYMIIQRIIVFVYTVLLSNDEEILEQLNRLLSYFTCYVWKTDISDEYTRGFVMYALNANSSHSFNSKDGHIIPLLYDHVIPMCADFFILLLLQVYLLSQLWY